jgi:Fe-S cluster assembly ATP-binding protein
MLKITNLHAAVDGKEILKGFDIAVEPGNGSGKSTLPYILTGRDGYDVIAGEIRYQRRDLLDLAPEERAAG